MRVKAKGLYYYAGHQYSAGDQFDVDGTPTHAWIRPLLDLGVLELVVEQQEAAPPAPQAAAPQAAAPQGTVAEATGQARGGDPSVNY